MKLKIKDNATFKNLLEIGVGKANYTDKVSYNDKGVLVFNSGDVYDYILEEVAIKIYKLTKAGLLEEIEDEESDK